MSGSKAWGSAHRLSSGGHVGRGAILRCDVEKCTKTRAQAVLVGLKTPNLMRQGVAHGDPALPVLTDVMA